MLQRFCTHRINTTGSTGVAAFAERLHAGAGCPVAWFLQARTTYTEQYLWINSLSPTERHSTLYRLFKVNVVYVSAEQRRHCPCPR